MTGSSCEMLIAEGLGLSLTTDLLQKLLRRSVTKKKNLTSYLARFLGTGSSLRLSPYCSNGSHPG